MSGPASLTRILSGALPPSDLASWLERVTADAIANDRCNIIQFPCNRRATMTHKQYTTVQAEGSLADVVIANVKAKEAEETGQAVGAADANKPAPPGQQLRAVIIDTIATSINPAMRMWGTPVDEQTRTVQTAERVLSALEDLGFAVVPTASSQLIDLPQPEPKESGDEPSEAA